METRATIRFRFSDKDGVDAARERAGVGARCSLSAHELVRLTANASFDTLDRAEKAGLLLPYQVDVPTLRYALSDATALPAAAYVLCPEFQLDRWLKILIEEKDRLVAAEVSDILALPIEAWIRGTRLREPSVNGDLLSAVYSDPRVVARRGEAMTLVAERAAQAKAEQLASYAALDPEQFVKQFPLHGRIGAHTRLHNAGYSLLTDAELETRLEELLGAQIAADAVAKAAAQRAEAECYEYAVSLGGTEARAAAAGYTVHTVVLDAICWQIAEAAKCQPYAVLNEGEALYSDTCWERRDSPRAEQLELRVCLAEAATTVSRPPCVEVDVSMVSRIELAEHVDGHTVTRKITGVVVTLRSPVTLDRCLVFSAE